MKLQVSPNNWSCMPTSLAMALGAPVEDVIRLAGHDGSHRPWPEPYNETRAGFHIHEMIDVAFIYYRRLLCPFVKDPIGTCDIQCPEIPLVFPRVTAEQRWAYATYGKTGIMTGQVAGGLGHAVAWDGQKIYDPKGYVYAYNERHSYKYEPDAFWLLGGYDGNPSKIVS